MQSMTVTMTDTTKTPRSLFDLLLNGSGSGYTVNPSAGAGGISGVGTGAVRYLNIQASKGNSSAIVYLGDESVAADGSRQGRELAAGESANYQSTSIAAHLAQYFITAGANGAKVNIEWNYD